jgi:protein-tyrosine-phosphatase
LLEDILKTDTIILLEGNSTWAVERLIKNNNLRPSFTRFREFFQDETVLGVPDPSMGGSTFKESYNLIDRGVKNFISRIKKLESKLC